MTETLAKACRAILQRILSGEVKDAKELNWAKIWACREFELPKAPRNSEILAEANAQEKKEVMNLLRRKPTRSISGVSVITVMPKPYPCPKEEPCIYCPGGPKYNTPQSYTGREPAAARALQNNYDPYNQVKNRIEQLHAIGHNVDKVELIMFGGTLTAYPPDYLEWFTVQCLNTMSGSNAETIEEAQLAAERAPIRISGIVLETRPDCCREPQVDLMLRLGATRVELGVQTVYNDIYKLINRGHTIEDVADATRIARDAGFTVIYHMMLNLPGSTYERDIEMFRTIFEDERFKPDALKIYPTLVMDRTKLHELWQRGEYRPYELEQIIRLIAEVKKQVPPWVRIQRIQRDIPANLIADGVKRGNLRVLVQEQLRRDGARCRCIRCREVGHMRYSFGLEPKPEDIKLVVERYHASEGEEFFLSFEDTIQDILIGFIRLRLPSGKAHRPEVTSDTGIVRELHVYGPMVPVGKDAEENEWQHRGWGRRLLERAEEIALERGARKMAVLSGIGVRYYYRRFGYRREGPYMTKELS